MCSDVDQISTVQSAPFHADELTAKYNVNPSKILEVRFVARLSES